MKSVEAKKRSKERYQAAMKTEAGRKVQRAYSAKWRAVNPDARRNSILKHKYGISLADYNTLLSNQGAVCAICKCPEIKVNNQTNKVQPLSVDHCHKSGRVRGLLCDICNTTLGKVNENVATLLAAIDYLKTGGTNV